MGSLEGHGLLHRSLAMHMLMHPCCSNQHVAALLVQPMSTERFVRRRWDGQIVEVDEFQVAKALSTAELEFLSHEVDSKNLFDWCLHFNHHRTAAALISYSVPGLPPPVACCTHGTQLQR